MLALAGVLAVGAGGASAAARVIPGGDQASFQGPGALHRPALALQRSIAQYRRAELRRLRSSRLVLGVPRTALEAIASCESGGDPRSISSDGSYRGKYQFDYGTWASVGGHGDPAAASELEQDLRAATLYKRAGSSPWPICG
jgi:Transglycosylase-like domain